MAVIINELVIKGKVKGGNTTETDVVKLIKEHVNDSSKNKKHLSESQKRSLINECVEEVLNRLNDRLSY